MAHPYAKILVDAHNNKENLLENSYIDFDKAEGMISWLPAGKEICHKTKEELSDSDKWTKGRQQVAIGKVIRAFLQNKGLNFIDKEIEQFVNEYKTTQNPHTFKLVKGKDITKYYNQDTYDLSLYSGDGQNPGRSLYGSCMRHEKCNTFFSVYENNDDISMLCLFNEKGLLIGRALIWENVGIENVGKVTFMDRIYTMDAPLEETFKNYAIQKGWWFKMRQGTNQETHVPFREISDGVKVHNDPKMIVYIPPILDYTRMRKPYIDTLRFFGYKMEGENLVPVLLSHRNDKDRSPKDLNWLERWDRLDGTPQGNGHYHKKRDIFNKMLPKKPFIKYENGSYWSDIETPENIYSSSGGHFTENYNTVLVLFDKNDTPLTFIAMNYDSNDFTRFQLGDKIKNITKKKFSKEYHEQLVDVLTHPYVRVNNVNNWIRHVKSDPHNFLMTDITSDTLNEKIVKEKPELFKSSIDNYNDSQLKMMAKYDDSFADRITIKNVVDFSKTKLIEDDILAKIASKFNIYCGEGKLWLNLSAVQIEELITYGLEPGVENLVMNENGTGLLELCYDWDYSTGDFVATKEVKKGDIVKLKPGSQYLNQSQGTIGVVDNTKGGNYSIAWKNGNTNTYSLNDILVQKTGSTYEVVRTFIKKLKKKMVWVDLVDTNLVGVETRVKLKPNSKFYGQAPETIGTITQVFNREPWEDDYYAYNVVWSNGEENGYRSADLIAEI